MCDEPSKIALWIVQYSKVQTFLARGFYVSYLITNSEQWECNRKCSVFLMLYLGSDRVKNWFFLFQFGGCSHRHHHQASHHLQVTQIYYYLLIFIIIYYQDCGPEWQGLRPRHPGEVAAGPAEPRTDWQGGTEESRGSHGGTGEQAGQDFITTWHQQAWTASSGI